MRVNLQPAFVLHSRSYRDTSLIVEMLSQDYGRFSLVAKGARKPSKGSATAALLQPFTPLLISFSGKSALKTLTSVELDSSMAGDGKIERFRGERLYSGMYINEVIMRLLHRDDPHPNLFQLYLQTLAALRHVEQVDVLLRQFELALLRELGYGFDLEVDGTSGTSINPAHYYSYHLDYGLVTVETNSRNSLPAFLGADLISMAKGEYTVSVRNTAKYLMRQVMSCHLGDKPLNSRSLFTKTAGTEVGD